jgi:hypothetical protein
VFWSIFTALIPTFFYFSIWELGVAGQELALLTTLSPVFLCIAPLRDALRTKAGLLILNLFSFSGLLAFASDNPLHRLFIISVATAASVIRQVLDWSGFTGSDVTYHSIGTSNHFLAKICCEKISVMALGLIVSSLSKHANHTNNPGERTTSFAFLTDALSSMAFRRPRNRGMEQNRTDLGYHRFIWAFPTGSLSN